jgi:hypothetical protein
MCAVLGYSLCVVDCNLCNVNDVSNNFIRTSDRLNTVVVDIMD